MRKILIPIEHSNGRQSMAFKHLGTAPFYFIADLEDSAADEIIENTSNAFGGDLSPLQFLFQYDVDTLLSMESCKTAIKQYNKRNIAVYITESASVAELLAKLTNDELKEYNADMAQPEDAFV